MSSALPEGIRSLVHRGEVTAIEGARQLKFVAQSPEAGLSLLLEEFDRTQDPYLLETIGDFYVSLGQRAAADSVFRRLYYEGMDLHVTNLIYAEIPATKALVDDEKRMLFIPIPKCGSTTVKNYFTTAIYGQSYGETVHFKHPELYRTVHAEELETTYQDYFRFSVVREPVSRLASYLLMNINKDSLFREALFETNFQGVPTRPGPHKMALLFHQYRQLFKDFRHHTDPASGFLDPFRDNLDKVYQMSDLPEIRATISQAYECPLDDTRAMVSKSNDKDKEIVRNALKRLQPWFKRDYDGYL